MIKAEVEKLLSSWRDGIVPQATALLSQLVRSGEHVLLDYAEKAENSALQSSFLQGQRELVAKEVQLVSLFRDNLAKRLFDFARAPERPASPGSEVLSLVSKESFERSLALDTISDQAIKNNPHLYHELSHRLGAVLGGPAVELKRLPAGPHQLATAFETTAYTLNVEREVLLALFTLFEHEVIRKSPPWHEQLNESLRLLGILPNLRYEVKRQPADLSGRAASSRPERPPGPAKAFTGGFTFGEEQPISAPDARIPPREQYRERESARDEPQQRAESRAGRTDRPRGDPQLSEQLLGRMRDILAARRARQASLNPASLRAEPVDPAPASVVAAAVDSPLVQRAAPLPETRTLDPGVQRVVVSVAMLEKLRTALSVQRAQIKEAVGKAKLSHFDEDTIDIVGMLFEVMLNDNRLPNTVKALLSHLHTPYLKLAIHDRDFLNVADHPARSLLDTMIEAGSHWVDESDLTVGLYANLQQLVSRILEAEVQNTQLFLELDLELSADIVLLKQRQSSREARTVEAERGKAKLDAAKQAAARAVERFLSFANAPPRYKAFILGPWANYLTLLLLRSNGSMETSEWHNAVVLGDRLRAFVASLTVGAGPSNEDVQTLRESLQQLLGDEIPQYDVEVSRLFELFSDGDVEIEVAATPWFTPIEPARAEPRPKVTSLSERGRSLLKTLPRLPSGTWLSVQTPDGPDRIIKLSWFNPNTERFLFVDQKGSKALVMDLRELADQIDKEQARVLLATGTSYVESSLQRALNALQNRP